METEKKELTGCCCVCGEAQEGILETNKSKHREGEEYKELLCRISRIEGQVRGVQRMIEEERACADILQQMAAIRSAVHQASLIVARAHAAQCLAEPGRDDIDAVLDQLMATLRKIE